MTDPAFRTAPRRHQLETYERSRDMTAFALFWEMGLGKTFETLVTAAHLFLEKRMDTMLIVTPNEVHGNWIGQEIPLHLSVPCLPLMHFTKGADTRRAVIRRDVMLEPSDRLRIVEISYDALDTDVGYDFARQFVMSGRCMMVLDESTMIKKPSAHRTRNCKLLGKLCHYRRVLTGTPLAESAFDAYSQIHFLDPDYWKKHGLDSFAVFKSEFGSWEKSYGAGGRSFPLFKEYRNLDRLNKLIQPISSRLLKEDSGVELPPKIYLTRAFELAPEQREAYDKLRADYVLEVESGVVEAPLAIVRLTRLQQITSGHVSVDERPTHPLCDADPEQLTHAHATDWRDEWSPHGDEADGDGDWQLPVIMEPAVGGVQAVLDLDALSALQRATLAPQPAERRVVRLVPPERDPRLQLLLRTLAELPAAAKGVVWCRFTPDVELITATLGEGSLRYDGAVDAKKRRDVLERFRDAADSARVLVANLSAMSRGVTLTIAKWMIYYSNSFSCERRLQSEDRNHRIGQDVPVTIVDLLARGTVDDRIVTALRSKFDVQALVMGDRYREWLQ